MQDTIKGTDLHVMGVTESDKREKGEEKNMNK